MASTTLPFTRLPFENLQCCDFISKKATDASLRRPFQLTTCDVTAWRPAYGAKHNSSTQHQRPLEPGSPPPPTQDEDDGSGQTSHNKTQRAIRSSDDGALNVIITVAAGHFD